MIDKIIKYFNLLIILTIVATTLLGIWYKIEPDPLQLTDSKVGGKEYTRGVIIDVTKGQEITFSGTVCFKKKFDVVVERSFYLVKGVGNQVIRDGSIIYPAPKEVGCKTNQFKLYIPNGTTVGNVYDYYPSMTYPINLIRNGKKEGFGFTFRVVDQ